MRGRISVAKEDRIWNLREQGYCYDSIARIVNCHPGLTPVIRRIRQRPPLHEDPVRRGRLRNFLSDAQVEDIRRRHQRGETYLSIAKSYDLTEPSVCSICLYKTYREPESKYPFTFPNRLMQSRR